MQLKSLTYLTTAATLVFGRVLTLEDVVGTISTFGSKAAALHQELEAVHSGSSILSLLTLNSKFGSMFTSLDEIRDDLRETPGPVSAEECTEVIDAFHQLQPISLAALKTIVDKKPVLDDLPGFGRASAVVRLTLHDMGRVTGEIQAALLALAPENCQAEAHSVGEQFTTACDAAIVAYR